MPYKNHLSPRALPAARLLACLLLLLATAAAAEDWPGFQGAHRDGVVQAGTILADWPQSGLAVQWGRDVGPGFGGAAIKDGKVFILDRDGNQADTLRVFDLITGKPLWSAGYDAPGRISYHGSRSTPMVTDRYVFTVGSFGHIACFDRNTQSIAWQKHMDAFGAQPPKWAWSQSPLILGDTVVFAPMADDAGLVALNQATGELAWKSPSIGNEGYGSPRLIQLAGTNQIVTFTATQVTGLDPKTGDILWSYKGIPVKRAIPTPAVVDEDKLFITAGYDAGSALIQIVNQRGRFDVNELKRDNTHGGQIHSALRVGQNLYANLNTNENLRLRGKNADGLGCFDLDGNLLWKNDNTPDINRGPLLAVGDKLLTLGGEDGVLRMIQASPDGYNELASTKLFAADQKKNMIWAPMAFADGYLVVRSQGELKCLDLRPKRVSQRR